MAKILCIGETLIRHQKDYYNSQSIIKYYVGGDALNVATSLSILGNDVEYLSVLNKESFYYQDILNHLNKYNIKQNFMIYENQRIGLYNVIKGNEFISSKVIYDRDNSCYKLIKDFQNFNDKLLANIDYIYLSGITISINKKLNSYILEILKKAKKLNKKIVIDINYRPTLWNNKYADFKKEIDQFLNLSDIVFGWISEQNYCKSNSSISAKDFDKLTCLIDKKYKNIELIISPNKVISQQIANIKSLAISNKKIYESESIKYQPIYPIGSGDSFVAAFLNYYVNNKKIKECLDFATKAYALKNYFEYDFNPCNQEQINNVSNESFELER